VVEVVVVEVVVVEVVVVEVVVVEVVVVEVVVVEVVVVEVVELLQTYTAFRPLISYAQYTLLLLDFSPSLQRQSTE